MLPVLEPDQQLSLIGDLLRVAGEKPEKKIL